MISFIHSKHPLNDCLWYQYQQSKSFLPKQTCSLPSDHQTMLLNQTAIASKSPEMVALLLCLAKQPTSLETFFEVYDWKCFSFCQIFWFTTKSPLLHCNCPVASLHPLCIFFFANYFLVFSKRTKSISILSPWRWCWRRTGGICCILVWSNWKYSLGFGIQMQWFKCLLQQMLHCTSVLLHSTPLHTCHS